VGFTGVSISMKNELFLQGGLDDPNQLEFVQKIRFCVKSNSRPMGRSRGACDARDDLSGKSMRPTARLSLDVSLLRDWKPRYARGFEMQATLALVSRLLRLVAFHF
jgi:hypothetical protein